MRSSAAHPLLALVATLFIGQCACGSRSALPVFTDAASTGGNVTTGGASAGGAGGTATGGAGGSTTTNSYTTAVDDCPVYVSHNPFCGHPPTGGTAIIGYGGGSGGRTGAGGASSSGGKTGTGDAGSSLQGCTCAADTIEWDCYCGVRDCTKTVNGYLLEAGTKKDFATLRDYADCGLIVVETMLTDSTIREVYARSTWRLVGEEIKMPAGMVRVCSSGADGAQRTLKAGQFPEPTCIVSRCIEGRMADSCGGADAGARGD